MGFVVSGFALSIMVIGVLGLASPGALRAFVRRWQTPTGLWIAAGLRIGFGGAVWVAAPASRTPVMLEILAGIAVASGIALPLVGLSRFRAIVSWWEGRSDRFRQAWAAAACAFGAFLFWAVTV